LECGSEWRNAPRVAALDFWKAERLFYGKRHKNADDADLKDSRGFLFFKSQKKSA